MKRTAIILAVMTAVLGSASCSKETVKVNDNAGIAGEGELIVSIGDVMPTKVSGEQDTNDKTIQSAQVFIFNTRTGQIDNAEYKTFTSTTGSCTMSALTCTYGEKEVWAIVNAPKDYVLEGAIKTIDDLKATTITLSNNKADALVMTGHVTKTLAAATETVTVDVERLVAAVVLKSVRNEMAVPAYRSKVSITGAYLMNVPSVQRLDNAVLASSSESATSSWSAFYGKATGSGAADLITESITETPIAFEQAHTALHTFYTFKSDFEKVEGKDNKTDKSSVYLVVECKVDGVACVYPILMPKLENNNKYEVSLTIKHVGGDPEKPWQKINFASFTPNINVVDWNNGGGVVSIPEII